MASGSKVHDTSVAGNNPLARSSSVHSRLINEYEKTYKHGFDGRYTAGMCDIDNCTAGNVLESKACVKGVGFIALRKNGINAWWKGDMHCSKVDVLLLFGCYWKAKKC